MNTKGTSPISTPSGGGAISGLGEKFSPDLFTGTGNFSVPIAVPPGRNGIQPELVLQYSSGSANDVFGTGWNIGLPGVTRKTSKGIPVYDDKTDIFILTSPEDLVPVKIENETDGNVHIEKTYYRPRTEGLFARIIRVKTSDGQHYWEVWSKDGMKSFYGTPGIPAVDDTCVIADPGNLHSIFAWYMSRTVDPFGNEMLYEYERDTVIGDPRSYDNIYFKKIKYCQYKDGLDTKYLCEVRFNYEERPDPFSSYKQGFEVRTNKRCTSIETWTNAGTLVKVKTYHFSYADTIAPAEVPLNNMSILKEIKVEGHNGSESEFMPPLTFGYSVFDPQKRDLKEIEGPLPGVSLADGGYELVDVDGNGLPDILQLDGITAQRWPNKGYGKFGTPLILDVAPSLNLRDPGVQLLDADGDGKTDLFVNNGLTAGFFSGDFKTVWSTKRFKPYPAIPSFSFADPEVKLMDLDGDGVTDVLRNGSSAYECFFNNPEKGFYKTRFTNKKYTGGFPNFSFADPRVRFADMTGDGMEDIVYINSGNVSYWPNLGYGRFGRRIIMKNSPRFPDEYDPAQVLVGDLDGDGVADIAFVENNRVTLYVNQAGNGFSDGQVIKGTPRVLNTQALRICDILGAGQSGILWSYGAGENIHGQMFFLDFTHGNKAYLLQEMNNNMGSITRVEYGSSVYHYLRDQQNPATRWKTDLPFPVLVVNKVEMLDLLSGGKLSTEYLYHHGYWDGLEREFRGFARTDQRDTETFERFNAAGLFEGDQHNTVTAEHYSPPTETRNWFYPGPVGEGYGRWVSPDFSDEYWNGDAQIFSQPQDMTALLATLPRRAQRDALRTLRGTLLRSELYALDNSPLQNNPYTITETQMNIRIEFDPENHPELVSGSSGSDLFAIGSSGYVFFPFNQAQRTSQYERGNDPMHSFSFTKNYDAYGQPQQQMSCGISRGANPRNGGGDYLGTTGTTEFIYVDNATQYMVTRTSRSLSYDATQLGSALNVILYSEHIFSSYTSLPLLGCSIMYYDGDAFEGLPFGQIGLYGVAVRSEALVLTPEIVTEAYGSTPYPLQDNPSGWPAEYPAGFIADYPNMGGYSYHTVNSVFPAEGWYAPGNRMKFDFQETALPADEKLGRVLETKDPFDNVSTVEYDDYLLLPVLATDPLGLTMQAEYDYRVMQAYRITDANANISVFDFSPLGLLRAVALIGKGAQGDYKSSTGSFYDRYVPSKTLAYDFFAFVNNGDPVWVRTTLREQHYQDDPLNNDTIVSVQFSDGFGRLLQTRNQAEDVIFGNSTFGTSGLPASQTATNQPAVGVERDPSDPLNVTVSGWQVYNNKGAVVEKYESFFDSGFDYQLPSPIGVKVKMYYDPRGQVIRTVNPDNSEQRVIFGIPAALNDLSSYTPTPWTSYVYDANDLAPLTNPTNSNVPSDHWYTPSSSLVDALGRVVQATNHHSFYNGSTWEDVVARSVYDIRGNVLKVFDPLGRVLTEAVYNMGSTPLKTIHLDAGVKTTIMDCVGRGVEGRDAKGSLNLSIYDNGSRPTHIWARDISGEDVTLRQFISYGDDSGLTDPEDENLKGQPYTYYDEAGLITFTNYDFKGNLLHKKRQVISDAEILSVFSGTIHCYRVDWTGVPLTPPDILDSKLFETNSEYDALNRPIQVTYPEDATSNRKIMVPVYNKAGALQSVMIDSTGYVEHIAYNAKGQRLLIAYSNGVMTRYAYSGLTFRLLRQRSETYTQAGWTFTSAGNVKQDTAYTFDLVGNIVFSHENVPGCGIGGVLGLDRDFDYDPLYRLLSATGRENAPTITPIWDDRYRSEDNSTTTAYTQYYSYDKAGNILELQHVGNSSFTRNFSYISGGNILEEVSIGMSNYDFLYNDCGSLIQENSTRFFEYDENESIRCFYVYDGSTYTKYTHYLYDSSGNRVKKLTRVSTGAYDSITYVDGAFEYRTDGTDEQTLNYVMDDTSRIASIREGYDFGDTTPVIKFTLEDHLGSSVTELKNDGADINREEYYAFGETSFGSYAKKRYKYQGKERDEESGLYYFGARYYCSYTCRFVSVDAVVQPGQSSYCGMNNNPINKVDPTGNVAVDVALSGTAPHDNGTQTTKTHDAVAGAAQQAAPEVQGGAANTTPTTGDGAVNYHSGQNVDLDRIGPRVNWLWQNVVVTPAKAIGNTAAVWGQSFAIGLSMTFGGSKNESDYKVTTTEGTFTAGSPELEKVNNAAQTDVAIGIMTMPLGEGVGYLGSRIFKTTTGTIGRGVLKGSGELVESGVETIEKKVVTETVETTVENTSKSEIKLLGTSRDNLLNAVENPKLKNLVNDLYRPNAKIGSGSSMDAFIYEQITGLAVGGKTHAIKLLNYRTALQKLLVNKNSLSVSDQRILFQLLRDIQNALSNYSNYVK